MAFLILILISGIGAADELIVQPGDSIQAVVDNASSGDVITIQAGTYTENLKIYTDSLTIRSESGDPDDTIIKAKSSTDNATFVDADGVKISGITVTAATGSGVSGICLSGCSNCRVENNKLTGDSQGVYLEKSKRCTVSNNLVKDNRAYGIYLLGSSINNISGNTVTNSGRGIYIGNSDDNIISGNTVTSNNVLGLYECSQCDYNTVYNNYFNNTKVTLNGGNGNSYNTTKTEGTNIIGGSYLGGNYWGKPDGTGFSDTAKDEDGDGISDSAYDINSKYSDYLPLVYPTPEPVPPVADFSSNVTSGDAPLTVKFTDKSTGDPTGWNWDFGDETTSTEQNPVHTYTSAGSYTVTLTASNADGESSKTDSINVLQSAEQVVADFTSNVTSGNAPLEVSFTDTSTGSPTAWNWDFGDGNTSADQNPVHIYTSAGAYTVTLTASNAEGESSKTDSVNVLQAPEMVRPVADFSTNTTQGPAPLAVQFTDRSQNAVSWSWDFDNDGQPDSTVQSPVYVYEAPGDYTVNLTVSNPNGTASKTLGIEVLEPEEDEGLPVADFSANVTSGYYPLTVLFTDLSQNATGRSWDVNGDGVEDSNEASFAYTYTSRGTYEAKLTATNENGTNTKTMEIDVKKKSSGGSSSGGGGGGGGSPEPARNVETKELAQVFIINGNAVKFDFTKNATCVAYVGFDSIRNAGKTTTIVEQLKTKSTLVSELSKGEVYKYFNVWVGNSGYATSKNIENPVVCFKVEKSWLQNENIDQDSIVLNRYNDEKNWEQLTANRTAEDDNYLYYTASVSGFSFFAITGTVTKQIEEESKQIPAEERSVGEIQSEKEETEETESNESTGDFNTITILSIVTVIGFLGLAGLMLKNMKE
ncbi:TPA: PGF-pre-PGF domain-containing protein [Methanosarcina acetivorans]|uniref:PGF-pre-PGF domain-containing protein n=1 Tax=Methanosarcina acetivorans TaxID=2214 RepID=A0A832WAX3_9EURY|nr:PKD domain-containing protein [Methanosarcina acetivorans]HIH95226.1 PGF-pre-PGF domain-containing protein [Methanosarcina acetivorans]